MSLSATSLRSTLIPRSTALTNAVLVVSGVLGLAALAQIALPVPGSPVPVTGQTLGVLFTFGLVWLQQYTGESWGWTFNAGLTPFIFGEMLKIAIAGTSLPVIWRVVNRKNS